MQSLEREAGRESMVGGDVTKSGVCDIAGFDSGGEGPQVRNVGGL